MALNTWINPLNKVSLTGSIDITADSIRLIIINENEQEEIINVLNLFLMYDNISSVEDVQVPLGGGQYYTIKAWVGTIDDLHIPGLESLIEYLQANYRSIDDDSTLNNYYTINKTYHIRNDYNYLKTNNNTFKQFHNYIYKTDEFNQYQTKQYNHVHKNYKETTLKTDEFNYNKKNIINNITIKKVPIYLNIDDEFTYNTKNIINNITIKKVPIYLNIEYIFLLH